MFRTVLTSAVFAGLGAGLCAALFQFQFVIPLLLEGELYETGARVHFAVEGSTQSLSQTPPLGTDWARHGMTVAFNFVSYTGFAFLLLAGMSLAALRGHPITPRSGLVWGLCGFLAVQLAPAFGLPPELPGTIAAEVVPRQIWWAGTILASGAGIALIAFGNSLLPLAGAVLIAVPHLVGAPVLDTYFGIAPPELSALFATRSLGAAAVGWTILGYLAGFFHSRLAEEGDAATA
ncbi:CbtA family protein [Oceaniglobus trochenteri]|uniref:CbtA family protein n=1 Tax=Oceaniglobus trochenteri TaxID=2763260 RepID=UPI001CFFA950|nr:CbtA family protein [Oceaniglobus trochenteri]